MGLLTQNPLIGDLTGTVGEMVFAKHKPGVKVVRKKPVRTLPPTEGELVNQSKFKCGILYAQAVWANLPELKARYNAVARLEYGRGFDLAKADFLLPPVVEEMDLSSYTGRPGEMIRVRAVDNFEVTGVKLTIRDLSGTVLEEGPAVLTNGRWVYAATLEVPPGQTVVIEATATDHPGHTGSKRLDHACGPRT